MGNKLYAIYTETGDGPCYLGWRTTYDEKYEIKYNYVLEDTQCEDVAWNVRHVAFSRDHIELVMRQLQRDLKHDPDLSCSFKGHKQKLKNLGLKIGEFVCQS